MPRAGIRGPRAGGGHVAENSGPYGNARCRRGGADFCIEGATPGKKLMGLTLTRPGTLDTRAPIGPARALLRLARITAGNVFFVDLIVAFLHRDRRALHDIIADTIVVEV
jgi:hypothetical protein